MKREMALIQIVLEYLEGQETDELVKPPRVAGAEEHVVCYHAELCHQAGYISTYVAIRDHVETIDGSGPETILNVRIGPLTWAGHDALDRLRSKSE